MSQRRIDYAIGTLIGLVLGIAVVAAFVFYGSEGSIDAPRISGIDTGKAAQSAPNDPAASRQSGERATMDR
jgi:hypothetical protein